MQSKEIIKQGTSTEWAVVVRTNYVSRTAVQNKQVQRHYTEKVRLANLDTYEATNHVDTDPNAYQFVKTTSDRTKRFLVTDGTSYRVVDAKEFIDLYSFMDEAWKKSEAQQAEQQRLNQQKQVVREQAVTQAEVNRQALEDSVKDNIKVLLGHSGLIRVETHLRVDGEWAQGANDQLRYDTKVVGTVTFPYQEFLRLVEKFNELQDA
jgi:hypothetical protein